MIFGINKIVTIPIGITI